MPELAKVETLVCYLKTKILREVIISFQNHRNGLRYELASNIPELIENSQVINVEQRAKYLNIQLSNQNSLVIHLGMSGQLTVQSKNYHMKKHDHIQIHFHSGNQLVYNDTRRFGMIYACKSIFFYQQDFLRNMGVEPLTKEFHAYYLLKKLEKKKISIKNAIMDSRIVMGVGNIYASEPFYQSKINPMKLAGKLHYK